MITAAIMFMPTIGLHFTTTITITATIFYVYNYYYFLQ